MHCKTGRLEKNTKFWLLIWAIEYEEASDFAQFKTSQLNDNKSPV